MNEKILIADSELIVANFLKKIVEYDNPNNLEVDIATNGEAFSQFISQGEYAVIILDLNLSNFNVLDFISQFSTDNPHSPIITMAATIDLNVALSCIRSGAYDFVTKPFTADTMMLVLKNAYEKRQLMLDRERLNNDIQQINDELMNANSVVTKQKEDADKSLKDLIEGIEKLKMFSESVSQIKSVETSSLNLFAKIDEIFKPDAMAVLLNDEKSGSLTVKKEHDFSKEFPEGTKINRGQFKQYFTNVKVYEDFSIRGKPDHKTVTIPLASGNLVTGLFIMDLKSEETAGIRSIFFEIVRIVITNILLTARFFEDSRRSYLESLISFLLIEEKAHPGLKKLSELVSSTSVKVAKKMNLPDEDLRSIQYAALLHLLGLTASPKDLFTAANYFDEEKFSQIRSCILSGAEIIEPLVFLENSQHIIKHMYENYDGSGVPESVSGKKIPIGSRIIRAAGEYHAFKTVFKLTESHIEEIFQKNSGKIYDPEVIELLFSVVKNK
ncbi:MAG: response regulator [bacterium]|nr:response regulator [bacterium]